MTWRQLTIRPLTILLLLTSTLGVMAQDADMIPPDLTAVGGSIEFLNDERTIRYKEDVQLTYKDIKKFADEVHVNVDTLDVEAFGNVRFEHADDRVSGDHLTGNLKTNEFQFGAFTGLFGKWIFNAGGAHRGPDGTLHATSVSMTTCESWWLKA